MYSVTGDTTCYRDCTDVPYGLPGGSCSGVDTTGMFHCSEDLTKYYTCASAQENNALCTNELTKDCYDEKCP